jgi:Skp family chaperone for outer membrane proteins
MALPSDEQGADSRLQVRFYKKPVQQDQESMDAGRPIYKEFDFVHICVAGDTLTEIDTYALQSHKQRFPMQWANYMNRVGANDEEVVGTPVAEWPLVSKSQAEELRAMKFHTVESIASASDQQLQRMGMAAGMSPYAFRDKAKAFLNLATTSAETDRREQEINALKEELAKKELETAKMRAETEAKMALMQEQMASILAAVGEKKPRKQKTVATEEA